MMISPEAYIAKHENDTISELISERNSLLKDILLLEEMAFSEEKRNDSKAIFLCPETQYQISLEYLAELCRLMSEKLRVKFTVGDTETDNNSGKIEIQKIGITKLHTDAVVNAANDGLWEGGGVCGAIFREAGSAELTKACKAIGSCKTGNAVITPGFKLPAKYIIHAVGPVWHGGNQNEPKLLYSAYKQSLLLAKENNCHTIGFPLISAGIFGYPKDKAWQKAIQACQDFIGANPEYDIKIIFAVLDDEIKGIGETVMRDLTKE